MQEKAICPEAVVGPEGDLPGIVVEL